MFLLAEGATTGISVVAGIIGIIVGIAGIVSVIIVMARQKALEASFQLTVLANGELREQVETGRKERHDQEVAFQKQLSDERAECARSLGDLQGKLSVLTSSLGKDIASSVVGAVGMLIESARADLATKVDAVKADTSTVNGQSLGELADQQEGRRQEQIPIEERTVGGQAYVDRVVER